MARRTKCVADKLSEEAQRLREEARRAQHPKDRDQLLRKARQTETAAQINEWVSSPGLRPPR